MYSDYFRFPHFTALGRRRPGAWAVMHGSSRYPDIRGTVKFYETPAGVLVYADIDGLPTFSEQCESPIFGFHIHAGGSCAQPDSEPGYENADQAADPFPASGAHYNPFGCPHPYHAGDLPPLFGVKGNAFSIFLTERFTVAEIIGKTVIIHAQPDDFHTQPSGNSGMKIACGAIVH